MLAGEQRKLAAASKRDSTSMKAISILATVFLPGTYIAVSSPDAYLRRTSSVADMYVSLYSRPHSLTLRMLQIYNRLSLQSSGLTGRCQSLRPFSL